MESLVFFGKGGIGKSTIAANVSVIFSSRGRKVLHVGCDPKGDSTLALAGRRIKHFADGGVFSGEAALRASIHPSLVRNVHCIEAGGPQAGVGCAGTGIGAMLDIMKQFSVLQKDGYDAVVFDVLGDVVCGGFAAPLRRGLAGKSVIVVSEEILSLYAANRLIAMINNYSRNGVWLAGLVVNAKDSAGVKLAESFALAARTRVLGVIERDPAIARAEKMHRTLMTTAPRSRAAGALKRLASSLEAARRPSISPRTLGDSELQELFSGGVRTAAPPAGATVDDKAPPAERIRRAGFKVTGLSGGQAICSWRGSGAEFCVRIVPASEAGKETLRIGDWGLCYAPGQKNDPQSVWQEICAAAAGLAGITFDDFMDSFDSGTDFYGNVGAFGELSGHSLPEGNNRPREATLGFGQWQRFIFPPWKHISIPPGAAMLEHGDMECRFSSVADTPLSSFGKSRGGLSGITELSLRPHLPKRVPEIVNSGFTYPDAVKGDDGKVAAALEAASRLTGPGGLIEFYCGCSPLLLASDLQSHFDRVAADGGIEVLRENLSCFSWGGPEKIRARADFVARRIKALGSVTPGFDVNLPGIGGARGALTELLAAAGFMTAPKDGDYYGNIAASKLQVLGETDPVLTGALNKLGVKWTCPPAPYGLAATRNWLAAVSKALGRKAGRGAELQTGTAAAYAALSKKARAFAAVFVAEPEEIACLDGGGNVSGVPLLSFLAEAGFSLKLLVHARSAAERALAAKAFKSQPALAGRRAGLSFFDSRPGLHKQLLADRSARLVYSDIPMDPRVAAAGKSPFSTALFEPGYEGAAETLRRLLDLCAWEFNGKYFSAKGL